MGRFSLSAACITFSCILSAGISVTFAAQATVRDEGQTGFQPHSASPSTKADMRRSERQLVFQQKVSTRSFAPPGAPTQPPARLHSRRQAKTGHEVNRMFREGNDYVGRFRRGVSRNRMRRNFIEKLPWEVVALLKNATGGTIEEFGALNRHHAHQCAKRPPLRLSEVRHLAQTSFEIPKFSIRLPPCIGVGKRTKCSYESGHCCTRPQTEFIGRYYDTAVAAMALGATRDEAFAPLVHARVLAHALQACDPNLNVKGKNPANYFKFVIRRYQRLYYSHDQPAGMSMITFPAAYEVLYELYNTMLIERMRSRRRVRLPTHAQMKVLNDAVYYKKVIARLISLDKDLNPDALFPDSRDFRAARMNFITSRMAKSSEASVENPNDSELHPSLRYSKARFSIYERSSKSWQSVDYRRCNAEMPGNPYYPFIFQSIVLSRWQGCCAKECNFMALYGRTFSAKSANCCSGCNRHSCSANTVAVANYLASISSIEAPSKGNAGAEEIAITV